jgi:enoyl-CoA hydratase/carnithine racemase
VNSPAITSPRAMQERAAPMLENVLYEKKGAVATVTVNRPKVLNALNTPTWADLRTAFEDARDDDSVRGVILTGAGDKAFIAGADISELAHATALEAEESSRFGQEVLELIETLGKPVMAAVNGFALGGGCETAMACTIGIAAENAKFGQPEVKLGLLPAAAARNACLAWSARAGPCSSSSQAEWSARRRRTASGSSTKSCPRQTSSRAPRRS